jgi:hypothetical protein
MKIQNTPIRVCHLIMAFLFTLSGVVQAQFTFVTNANNTITITGYTGLGGLVVIPDMTNGYPVTSIGTNAFYNISSLTNVMIPNSVTDIGSRGFAGCYHLASLIIPNSVISIGDNAFFACQGLTNVTIGDSVTSVGNHVFDSCYGLVSVTIPNSVTNIGSWAFYSCENLVSVTIGNSVAGIGSNAFMGCTKLMGVYFKGNAPSLGSFVFLNDKSATVYYLARTTGWGNFAQLTGLKTVLWDPQARISDGSFGVQTNQFGFNITGSSNLVIVVEACTNLTSPIWSPISTNTLNTFVGTNGMSYFSDSQWTNYTGRFYRFSSP